MPADSYSEEQTMDKLVIQQCMSRLNDDERQILVLHAVAGFKHREIAALMDLALPTVLSKYHRAIRKLRNYI
jgi:RNA polymerase sigma-70 factor (ECF subfamily)